MAMLVADRADLLTFPEDIVRPFLEACRQANIDVNEFIRDEIEGSILQVLDDPFHLDAYKEACIPSPSS